MSFRRMKLVAEVDRINALLESDQEHAGIYRKWLGTLLQPIGRIGERIGEPEPEEPRRR